MTVGPVMRDLGPSAPDGRQGDPEPREGPSGDRSKGSATRSPGDPTPPSNGSAASDLFARTKLAVEHERASAERVGAWTHVLATPEEIGASQDGWWRRMMHRPVRLSGAGSATDESAFRRDESTPGLRAEQTAPPDAGGAPWAEHNGTSFVVALCMAVLVTALLFGVLLGLPGSETTSQQALLPVTPEERPAVPGAGGEPKPPAQASLTAMDERRAFEERVARLGAVDGNREPPAAAAALEILIGADQSRSTDSDPLTGGPGYPKPVLKPRNLVPEPAN